jgi:hypothetical protein
MSSNWEETLRERLPAFGHRNWLVIADSAYPAQCREGIETIVANDEQTHVLAKTFAILDKCKHIRPKIYTDQELSFVSESDAPGISSYREHLGGLFKRYEVHTTPHEEIISRLDRAAEMFRVLLIKTNMRIPYTSVFLEFDCGYWNKQSEDRLRAAMRGGSRGRDARLAESVSR